MTGPRAWPGRVLAHATIHPQERRLAGLAASVLYLLGAATLVAMGFLPAIPAAHRPVLLGIAALTVLVAGAGVLWVPWQSLPQWFIHPLHSLAFVLIALAVASSGGAVSPAWVYLLMPAFIAAYFYERSVAVAYLVVCAVVEALPLLYDGRAIHDAFLARLLVSTCIVSAIALGINASKRRMWALHARTQVLAAQQSSLRRVATAVVGGRPADAIYEMVAREAAGLLGAEGAGILRLREDGESLLVVGAYAALPGGSYRPGTVVPVRAQTDLQQALSSRAPVRADELAADSPVARIGYRSTLVAPVNMGQRVWGVIVVAAEEPMGFGAEDEQLLTEFGDFLATAIVSAEERTRLAEQALTDSLTGVANQRALQARLAAELARANRHGAPLCVAVIDIDHFKDVNDTAGHEVGDEMLLRVAAALSSFARAEDTVGRLGGDEFAWVLPDTTREQALAAVERARRLIAAAPPDPVAITISAGICETDSAAEATELLRLADSALYWSKAHGRNQTWIYDPAVVDELSEQQRAQRLERAQELSGLRALVRAFEERDPATREHSERVAGLASRLALRVGWSRERALALGQAAALHDIGRIAGGGGPAPIWRSEAELGALRSAAELSAGIVAGLLDGEQAEWIRRQYAPLSGSADADLDQGASLIAVADVWDTLTAVTPGLPAQALGQCERLAGACLTSTSVAALAWLLRRGELGSGPADHSLGSSA